MEAYGFEERGREVDSEDGKQACFPVQFSIDWSQVVLLLGTPRTVSMEQLLK